MQMGQYAYTVASHLTMVGILGLLIVRVMLAPHGDRMRQVVDAGFKAGVAIAAVGLIIERLYYVLARFLKPQGLNLWDMHPAPEVLSMVVALGLYCITVPMVIASRSSRISAMRQISVELSFAAVLWVMLVWWLY